MIKQLLLAFILLYFALKTEAQSDFRFKNYTISDGLSQSSVTEKNRGKVHGKQDSQEN